MTTPAKKVPAGYPSGSRIAAKVVLQDVRLSEARLEVTVPPSAGPRDVELDINLRTAWELTEGGLAVQVGVWARLLAAHREDGDEPELVMSIVVEHTVEYALPDGLDPEDEEVQGFVDQSAVLTAWPFARETVQGLAARAGVPQLTLPIHKVSLPTPPPPPKASKKATAAKKVAAKKAPAKKTTAAKKVAAKKAPAGAGTRRGGRKVVS